MAEIVFVTPAATQTQLTPPPESFGLLRHHLHHLHGADQALEWADSADLAIVDARDDLAGARTTCLLLRTADWPVLLLVPASGLSVIGTDWSFNDFIQDDASPAEIETRIRLLLASGGNDKLLSAGPVVVDEAAWLASVGGEPLDLTYTEFELLKYLVAHPGRVLSREQLLSEVWGYDYFGGTRTVDVHIRRLRAKLGAEHDSWITTVRNVGYRFAASR